MESRNEKLECWRWLVIIIAVFDVRFRKTLKKIFGCNGNNVYIFVYGKGNKEVSRVA